jgi:hypothetical protein
LLLTPPAPSTTAEGTDGLPTEGCPGDNAELSAPDEGPGGTLICVELVHVPGIGNRSEDLPIFPKRASHAGKGIQENLGRLRAHRTLAELACDF